MQYVDLVKLLIKTWTFGTSLVQTLLAQLLLHTYNSQHDIRAITPSERLTLNA